MRKSINKQYSLVEASISSPEVQVVYSTSYSILVGVSEKDAYNVKKILRCRGLELEQARVRVKVLERGNVHYGP